MEDRAQLRFSWKSSSTELKELMVPSQLSDGRILILGWALLFHLIPSLLTHRILAFIVEYGGTSTSGKRTGLNMRTHLLLGIPRRAVYTCWYDGKTYQVRWSSFLSLRFQCSRSHLHIFARHMKRSSPLCSFSPAYYEHMTDIIFSSFFRALIEFTRRLAKEINWFEQPIFVHKYFPP